MGKSYKTHRHMMAPCFHGELGRNRLAVSQQPDRHDIKENPTVRCEVFPFYESAWRGSLLVIRSPHK